MPYFNACQFLHTQRDLSVRIYAEPLRARLRNLYKAAGKMTASSVRDGQLGAMAMPRRAGLQAVTSQRPMINYVIMHSVSSSSSSIIVGDQSSAVIHDVIQNTMTGNV